MILIDADMIVTRPLTDLIDTASGGRVVAFRNSIDRHVPEWGELLGLGPPRRQPYVSSGLVALGGALGADVLRLVEAAQARADFDFSVDFSRKDAPDHPLRYLDQDVLNAVLATHVAADRLTVLDQRLAPHQPFMGLRVTDEATLRCAYEDATQPYVLHQYVHKPWIEPMYHGIYSRLLARALLGDDVAIRIPERDIPRRMRSGPRARVERTLVNVFDLVRWYMLDVAPEWLRGRVRALRERALRAR